MHALVPAKKPLKRNQDPITKRQRPAYNRHTDMRVGKRTCRILKLDFCGARRRGVQENPGMWMRAHHLRSENGGRTLTFRCPTDTEQSYRGWPLTATPSVMTCLLLNWQRLREGLSVLLVPGSIGPRKLILQAILCPTRNYSLCSGFARAEGKHTKTIPDFQGGCGLGRFNVCCVAKTKAFTAAAL